jgi:hypothetical protein
MNQMVDVDGIPFGSSLRLAAAPWPGRKEDSAMGGFDGAHGGAPAGNRDLRAKELNS